MLYLTGFTPPAAASTAFAGVPWPGFVSDARDGHPTLYDLVCAVVRSSIRAAGKALPAPLHKNHDGDMGMKIAVSRGADRFIFASATHYVRIVMSVYLARKNATQNFKSDVRFYVSIGQSQRVPYFLNAPGADIQNRTGK
ncbi:MAG: hypothetical protein KGJ49_00240 [Alphaproteobacteria bacterium]|nr:hypothetical protein [Alphaproteobacteria bacterium]